MHLSEDILTIDDLNYLARKPASTHPLGNERLVQNGENQLWEQLLATVHASGLSDKHLTATCNAICFYIRNSYAGRGDASKSLPGPVTVWRQTFQVCRRAFVAGKNKPALQVLDTLSFLIAQISEKQDATEVVEEAVCEMAKIVYSQHSRQSLKEACIVLYFFFRRLSDFMSATEVLEHALARTRSVFNRRCTSVNVNPNLLYDEGTGPWLAFTFSLLLATNVTESKSAALKLLSLLCAGDAQFHILDMVATTSMAVDIYSASNTSALDEITKEVLPAVLISDGQYYDFFAKQMTPPSSVSSRIELILGVLAYGKSRKIVTEADLPDLCNKICFATTTMPKSRDKLAGIRLLLSHTIPGVRLRALDLLLASTSPNALVATYILEALVDTLPYLHNDTDAFYRGELISLVRRFLTRLQQSYRVLTGDPSEQALHHRQIYHTFCKGYWNFLTSELSAHHSYSRIILSLETLSLIVGSLQSQAPFNQVNTIESSFLSRLFWLSVNPYDDIRMLSVLLVQKSINVEDFDNRSAAYLVSVVLTVSQLAARTNRADHADALGRLIALSLRHVGTSTRTEHEPVTVSNGIQGLVDNISKHVNALDHFIVGGEFPLHGSLLGVKYIFSNSKSDTDFVNPQKLQTDILLIASKVWTLCQPHLCVDSPEHEADESYEETDSSGPKDTLAYAWRALRDSNLMIQAILNCYGHEYSVISEVGDFCLDQLTRLRHRGAFSTVAQTFLICCQKARASVLSDTSNLIAKWFAAALIELHKQAEKLTRRSAGLPAMFTALLDPGDLVKFNASMSELVSIAIEPVSVRQDTTNGESIRLPQVHALNCLKDIMINSRFKTVTESHIGPMTQLAAQCMNSQIWAIKNCGLMLFCASIGRLDPKSAAGMPQSGLDRQVSLYRNMRPIDVAFSLLARSHTTQTDSEGMSSTERVLSEYKSATELIFAGLDLLSRLRIEDYDKPNARRHVLQHASSRIWHVRTQVARLLIDMTSPTEEVDLLAEIFNSMRSCADANRAQSELLTVRGLLDRLHDSEIDSSFITVFADGMLDISDSVWSMCNGDICALWLEIAEKLLSFKSTKPLLLSGLGSCIRKHLEEPLISGLHHHALYKRAHASSLIRNYIHNDAFGIERVVEIFLEDDDLTAHVFRENQHLLTPDCIEKYLTVAMAVFKTASVDGSRSVVLDSIVGCLGQVTVADKIRDLEALIELISFDQCFGREAMMSQICLYTVLCKIAWQKEAGVTLGLARLSSAYCLHLRLLADDQTEESARWAVIKSLQQWRNMQQANNMLDHLFGLDDKLELLLVIYDLLNDDDVEIRASAAEISALFSGSSNDTSKTPNASCALASRELLRDEIATRFSQGDTLACTCVRRVTNIRVPVAQSQLGDDIVQYCHLQSVQEAISEIATVANDLFAEEKQNLYVDDIAEVQAWMQVYTKASCRLPDRVRAALLVWVREGLDSMQRLLLANSTDTICDVNDPNIAEKADGDDSRLPVASFGIGVSQDIEILILRVVTAAGLLVRHESDLEASDSVCMQLTQLEKTCRGANLPEFINDGLISLAR